MNLKVVSGDITQIKTGAIIAGLYQGERKPAGAAAVIDAALDGAVSALIKSGEIKGKPDEVSVVHSLGKLPAGRVAVIGLGKKKELTADRIRGAAATACRLLVKSKVEDIAISVPGIGVNKVSAEAAAQAIAEGAILGVYSFRRHITKKDNNAELKKLTLVAEKEADVKALKSGSRKGKIMAEAACLTRDMVNEPANYMTPTHMAETASKIAQDNILELTILERKDMQKLGMGALLGVAQGSSQPPKFIILNYKGRGGDDIDLALVGKGVTFDSGGISIKPSSKMEEMKGDMAGGAAMIAAMSAIAQLKPKINVTVIVPATENLPDGSAIKPGDVLTAMNGKTIEVINTDAEGRLILADALCYANKLKVKRIVDAATLTGACVIALGHVATGAFGNNQRLVDDILAASKEAGEHTWQMPMFEEYRGQNKSDVADVKNVGGRDAGAITAAMFLSEFCGDTPWVHLDIAGTSYVDKEKGYIIKGATGVPVRTLVNLALALAGK